MREPAIDDTRDAADEQETEARAHSNHELAGVDRPHNLARLHPGDKGKVGPLRGLIGKAQKLPPGTPRICASS